MKFSTNYFHVKTKILTDLQICISVPLNLRESKENTNFGKEEEESCKKVKVNFGNKSFYFKLLPRKIF